MHSAHPLVVLKPDFQRHHVWDNKKRRKYIEFCLRGGKWSRNIYWNCTNWPSSDEKSPLELVDGLQRLTAIRKFMSNRLKVFGLFYREFQGKLGLNQDLLMCVNDLKKRSQVLQWYLEINDGGVIHTRDELQRVHRLLTKTLALQGGAANRNRHSCQSSTRRGGVMLRTLRVYEPLCVKHGWVGDRKTAAPCPHCAIARLRAEVERLRKALNRAYGNTQAKMCAGCEAAQETIATALRGEEG